MLKRFRVVTIFRKNIFIFLFSMLRFDKFKNLLTKIHIDESID